MLRIGFFASHNGSNMQAVVRACGEGRLKAVPALVIGNNAKSGALEFARNQGLNWCKLNGHTHPDPADLDRAILAALEEHDVDLVMLAGYMKRLGPLTVAAYRGRVLNIHPALLPKFGGQGMFGIHVHEAVLEAGESETGVTIHLVDEEYDHGETVAQCRVPVEAGDDAAGLQARVLKREHSFLVETLEAVIEGRIVLPGLGSAGQAR